MWVVASAVKEKMRLTEQWADASATMAAWFMPGPFTIMNDAPKGCGKCACRK